MVMDQDMLTVTTECLETGLWSGLSAGCYLVQCHPPEWEEMSVTKNVQSNPTSGLGVQYGLGTKVGYECKYVGEDFHFGSNILAVDLTCGEE